MQEKLISGMQKLDFSQEQIARIAPLMETYISELILFNSAYNLVNTNDPKEIAVRHILDSLSAAKKIQDLCTSFKDTEGQVTIADIGSGGGLPGIPLAAFLPDVNFALVERMSKRCAFLENQTAILGLKNVQVQNIELERLPADSFNIATFRAFRPLEKKMFQSLLRVLKPNGLLCAYKAKKEKIVQEMQGAGCSKDKYSVTQLFVPFLTDGNSAEEDRERNLVVIKK